MLQDKLTELIEMYAPIDDAQERMALIVDSAGRRTQAEPASLRSEENRVRGCVSAAWIEGRIDEQGRCMFVCAADSPLVGGLLTTLCGFFSGAMPEEVASSDLDPLEALGLVRHLSPTRRNGLASARKRIRELALGFAAGPRSGPS